MFPRMTGMLGLPCRPCSGMLRSGCKWSLIRLCTHHVQRVPVALMLVKLAVATRFKCPSSWHNISNGHFVHLGTSPKQCGSCASTRKPKAYLGFLVGREPTREEKRPSSGGNPYSQDMREVVIAQHQLGLPTVTPELMALCQQYKYPAVWMCRRYIRQFNTSGHA
jgi:hypothetical protein